MLKEKRMVFLNDYKWDHLFFFSLEKAPIQIPPQSSHLLCAGELTGRQHTASSSSTPRPAQLGHDPIRGEHAQLALIHWDKERT